MLKSGGHIRNKLIFQTGQKATQSGQGAILSLMCKMLVLINKMELCLQKETPQGVHESRVTPWEVLWGPSMMPARMLLHVGWVRENMDNIVFESCFPFSSCVMAPWPTSYTYMYISISILLSWPWFVKYTYIFKHCMNLWWILMRHLKEFGLYVMGVFVVNWDLLTALRVHWYQGSYPRCIFLQEIKCICNLGNCENEKFISKKGQT